MDMKKLALIAVFGLVLTAVLGIQKSYAESLLSVGIAQLDSNFDPDLQKRVQTNLGKLSVYAGIIKGLRNVDLLVFPEVFIHGPDSINFEKLAEPIPSGPTTQALMKLAKDLKIWLIPGTLMEKGEDGKLYNTAIVISPEGKFVAKYRKMFPARPVETPDEPGSNFVVFDIPGKGRIGVIICYDATFPEVTRTLVWMGAEVIIKPTFQDDSEGGEAWRTPINITRALENQAYVVDCNVSAPMGNGFSAIIDPEGRVVEKLGNVESYTSAVIDFDLVRRVREYGSFAGGFTILKHWAYLRKVKEYPPYVKGIEKGEVFKTLTPSFPNDPSQIKLYKDQK
jgi:predicted amidohydrolase